LETFIEALWIETLETRLGLHRFVCASLELELEFAATDEGKDILVHRWIATMKACYVLQLALDLLTRQQETGPWNTSSVD
jgi:hypothetical protein